MPAISRLAGSGVHVAQVVVRSMVAGEPAAQLAGGIAAPSLVDRLDIGSVDGELDRQVVGIDDVQRAAVAVLDHPMGDPGGGQPRRER